MRTGVRKCWPGVETLLQLDVVGASRILLCLLFCSMVTLLFREEYYKVDSASSGHTLDALARS